MAIVYDQSSYSITNAYGGGPVTKTWSHTCNVAGVNRLLVLAVDIWQDVAGTGSVTSASYGGVAMTKVTHAVGTNMRSEIWYLIAPATGANTMSVTVTGATDSIKCLVSSFTGAAQSSVLDASNTAIAATGNPSVSLTTLTADCMVFATVSRYSTDPGTSNQTPANNDNSGSTLGAASYQFATTTGSYTDTYTGTSANDWSMVIASFKPLTTAPNVIAYDASSSTTGAAVSSLTWSHTCTGTNRKLRVAVQVFDDTSQVERTVASVTYNGVALTRLGRADSGFVASELWELIAPATGTNSVVVTLGAANDFAIAGATSFTGCDQTTTTNVLAEGGSGQIGSADPFSTTVNNAWVSDSIVKYSLADGLTASGGQTTSYLTSRGNAFPSNFGIYGASGYKLIATAGSASPYWTWTLNDRDFAVVIAELTPSGTATLEQEGYRWRYDNGTETSASFIAAQDTDIIRDKNLNTRLRVIVNSSGDTDSTQYRLEYRVVGSGSGWTVVD